MIPKPSNYELFRGWVSIFAVLSSFVTISPDEEKPPADKVTINSILPYDQREKLEEASRPQGLNPAEKAIVREWQNSENGILRALFYQQDPFSKDFNRKNPDTNKPLTLDSVRRAFSSNFQMPVKSLIRVNHDLTDFDQANPHYVYLSSPVQWNSTKHNKQLFRIIKVTKESVDANKLKISENNFTSQEGGKLNPQQIEIALKILNLINGDYWDVRSPYSGSELTTSNDGKLNSLDFKIGIVKQPNALQPRKIIFMNSRFDETPRPSDTNIFVGDDGLMTVHLKPEQFENITE